MPAPTSTELMQRCPGGMNPGRGGTKLRGMEYPPSARMPMHWHESSNMNMRHQDFMSNHAEEISTKLNTLHASTKVDNITRHQLVDATFVRKIKTSKGLIDVLTERIKSVSQTIEKLRTSHGALRKAYKEKEKPLKLCMERQQIRARRPTREQIRDPVETALEDEKELLHSVQDRIQNNAQRTELMVKALSNCLEELRFDEELKFHAMDLDMRCQRTLHRTWPHSEGGDVRQFSLPPVKKGPYANWNVEAEETRQGDCHARNSEAKDRENGAQVLCDENDELIRRTLGECQIARDKVDRALQGRVDEIQGVRKKLDASIKEVASRMEQMQRTHSLTINEMRSHDEPFELVERKGRMRSFRKHREVISDPVTTALQDHKQALKKNLDELDRGRHEVRQTLSMLAKTKADLEIDLRDKTAALHLDLDCQKTNSSEQKMLFEMFLL